MLSQPPKRLYGPCVFVCLFVFMCMYLYVQLRWCYPASRDLNERSLLAGYDCAGVVLMTAIDLIQETDLKV